MLLDLMRIYVVLLNKKNMVSMTYGDLLQGYKDSLQNKPTSIGQQFEYNQFQRDFYNHFPEKTRLACNQVWRLIKHAPGGSTYADYLQLILSKKRLGLRETLSNI